MPATFIAVWTAHGTYTWTCPSGVSAAQVEVWGAGGGGAAASTASEAGGAGGGGEYAAEPSQSVTSGTGYTVIVGTAGSGQAGLNDGNPGGNSTFNTTTVVAHGGGGGTANEGSFGPTVGGGPGGTGSSNTTHFDGGTGGGYAAKSDGAGGGGGSGGTGSAGNNGTEATSSSGGAGATAVTGGGPGGRGANAGTNNSGSAPVSGPGGGGGGGSSGGSATGGNGFDGQARITWSMNSPATLSAATTGGTYTWTAPAGITSVSWVITGTASFNGNSSSGNQTVTPGTAYTITVAAGGSLTITWGGSADPVRITPGPSWLRRFKPGLPKPRPVTPPLPQVQEISGSVAIAHPGVSGLANVGNPPQDLPAIAMGPTWRRLLKPGMRKPRPVLPWKLDLNTGSVHLQRPGTSGSVTQYPSGQGTAHLARPGVSGTVGVPVVTSGSVHLKHPGVSGTVGVPVVTSGSVHIRAPGIRTPPTAADFPHITPGPAWLARFKHRRLQVPRSPQYIGSRSSVAEKKPGITGQIIQYLPFPQFPLNILVEILINGTWQDITRFVYQRDGIHISRGLPDETQAVQPSQMTLTLNNRDGRFSPNNPLGAYYPYLTRNVQMRCSVVNQASANGTPYNGYRFWGEVSSFPPRWDPSQSDIYCQVTVSGVLRRYIQAATLGSTLRQYYTSLTGDTAPYAYWPGEDGNQASEISSALPSVASMTFTGNPGFASNTAFGGSDALPTISSSIWHGETGAAADPPGTGSITNTNPGTHHWTAPPGVTQVTSVTATGGGGGGGDADSDTGGGGGGGGGVGKSSSVNVTAGTTYSYTVGAGGAAGSGIGGTAGSDSSFTGDSQTVTGRGGAGGSYAGSGGAGGAGATFSGGSGGSGTTGQSGSSSSTFSDSLTGFSGGTGGGHGGTASQQTTSWTAPDGVQSPISVTAIGGGGGGHGGGSAGAGGGGGGGGGYASGSVDVTAGSTYTFNAGSGGNGGNSNTQGDAGAASGVNGDSMGCFGNGGGGSLGSGGASGGGIVVGSGSGTSGSSGGNGATAAGGFGGGGGGGGGSGSNPGTGGNAHPSGSQTRQPGSGGGNGSGGGWGTSSYPGGSGATTGGTGGSYGGGGGGGGSITSTTGTNGGGGGPGTVSWTWTVSSSFTINPTGGGGGSSAGTSTGGHSGSSSGSGGSAVSGGGAGGSTGSLPAGGAPGGGGAGGVPDTGSGALVPGAGAAGQVSFAWSGGTTSPVAADIIRFCLDVDSAGAADGAILLRALTYGTVSQLDLVYHTGGNLELIGYNSSSVSIFDSGSISFGADGTPLYVSLELTASGSNVNYTLTAIKPGGTSAVATHTGSVAGSVGFVSDIYVDPAGTVVDSGTSIGQITCQTYADSLLSLSDIVNGFSGERAADRISRLCAAQGIGFTLVGTNTDTPKCGPQQDDTFTNIIQSCADLDRGQLFETRDSFGIGYRTRVSLQGQNPVLTADYSQATLAGSLEPTADDQYTRNQITVTRNGGASSTAALTSGAMSTATPPNGVGVYSYQLTVQANTDSQLANLAAWMLSTGTVDQYRYPQVTFDLARTEVEDLFAIIAGLDVGDYIQVVNPPQFLQSDPISQLSWGFSEVLNTYTWTISINCVPESPYSQGNPPTW